MARADKYFHEIEQRKIPTGKVFSLQECIDTALKKNLDLKVYALKEDIEKEKQTAAMLGMLPDLTGTFSLNRRNNEPGASSESLESGTQSLEPSKSAEKQIATTKVEMMFSIVDFGLSFFTAQQDEDREAISIQQRKRAAQNLVFDVAKAYYRVAATQHAMENTDRLLKLSKVVENNLDQIAKARSLSPMRLLAEKKQILRLKQRIEEYQRLYENSCIELKTLMGYAPWEDLRVDISCLDTYNRQDFPDIDALEMTALQHRPELYQLDAQTRISILEARKAVLMMFPNVQIVVDFNNSTNKYLYNQSWWEMGAKAAYNLLRLPQQYQRYKALDMKADADEARILALTAGIMAQVRIAHANINEVEKRYLLSQAVYNTHLQQLRAAKEEMKAGGRVSQLAVFKMAMETASSSIERTQQLGNYYLAHYRLVNSTGLDSFGNMENSIPKIEKPGPAEQAEPDKQSKATKKADSPEAEAEKTRIQTIEAIQ